jgi:hypothetical protein
MYISAGSENPLFTGGEGIVTNLANPLNAGTARMIQKLSAIYKQIIEFYYHLFAVIMPQMGRIVQV